MAGRQDSTPLPINNNPKWHPTLDLNPSWTNSTHPGPQPTLDLDTRIVPSQVHAGILGDLQPPNPQPYPQPRTQHLGTPPPILIPSPHPPAPPRRQFDPSFQVQNLPPSVLGNAGCWALHMGVSSNLRYQILGGLDPVRMCLGRTLWSL